MSVNFHFLNVGYGDCTIIYWPERTAGAKTINERIMMMDIYHHEDHDEYENVIEYYKTNFSNANGSIKPIFRFVCSHPHQDHICGIKKLFDDNGIQILNFWDLNHSFEPTDFEGHPTHKEDWQAYKTLGGPSSPATVLKVKRETTPGNFWNTEGDRITVLSPSSSLIEYAHYKVDDSKRTTDTVEIDEMSYALAIQVNNRTVVLAGDGRATPTWDNIYENSKSVLKNCYVLKAGHHGHKCSFHEEAVNLMNPVVVVMSNSKEKNKSHGAEKEYKKVCPDALICKTWEGTVIVQVPFDSEQNIQVVRA